MAIYTKEFVSLSDLYVAYKKAKYDVFYEHTNHLAIQFARYEQNLEENLKKLLAQINGGNLWSNNFRIGTYAHIPKSLSPIPDIDPNDFFFLDSRISGRWRRKPIESPAGHKVQATFRILGLLSVDFHIISALWILKVGFLYDGALGQSAYGCRLRRYFIGPNSGQLNLQAPGLFRPYGRDFQRWRSEAFSAIKRELPKGPVVAMTLDLRSFYHKVSPDFLLNSKFLKRANIRLSVDQKQLTQDLLIGLRNWAALTPDHKENPNQGLPVGVSCSKLIANAVLLGFDELIHQKLDPMYYGRYVDDILLVLPADRSARSGVDIWRGLEKRTGRALKLERSALGTPLVRINLDYAESSELVFAGGKQKIFFLEGQRGRDLLRVIEDQIKNQASEWRLLPEVPSDESAWFKDVIAASEDGEGAVDNLRKADIISVRRHKFSLLLRNMEAMQRQLAPRIWKVQRKAFYRFVKNHVITPTAIFEFVQFYFRIFGLAFACGDYLEARQLIKHSNGIVGFLEQQTSTPNNGIEYRTFRRYLGRALIETLCQSTGYRYVSSGNLVDILRDIKKLGSLIVLPSPDDIIRLAKLLFERDLARDPYRKLITSPHEYGKVTKERGQRFRVLNSDVLLALHIKAVRYFARLVAPGVSRTISEWPLLFPTRPFTLGEMTLLAPGLLKHRGRFWTVTRAIRGVVPRETFTLSTDDVASLWTLRVGSDRSYGNSTVALPCIETQDKSWKGAATGKPDTSFVRFSRLHRLLNEIISSKPRPKYVVFPELSIPRKWMTGIAYGLARSGINLVAGVEYEHWAKGKVSNQALISLVLGKPGFHSQIVLVQEKQSAAHEEAALLKALGYRLVPRLRPPTKYLIRHKDLDFGVLICSELTDVTTRVQYRGQVDAVFVVEWNQDLNSFESLVEASALDIHCYVVQSNNRKYGDCRIRVPHRDPWERDLVKIKGGVRDYFVISSLNVIGLRSFQSKTTSDSTDLFKPTPDGFRMSADRWI